MFPGAFRPAFLAVALGIVLPATAAAQLKRDALVQPVGLERSEALIGIGFTRTTNAALPLAGHGGDLTAFPVLHAAWAIGPHAVAELKGAVRKVLSIESRDRAPAIALDPSVRDGTTRDVGDFEIGVSIAPLRGPGGFSAGGHLGVKLPNSDESMGIGTNTTDVTMAALFSWASARWRATGWFGVSILEVPAEPFEQNDAFAWAFEALWDAAPSWRLSVGTRGRASTRSISPPGTGDLGELRATVEWRRGPVAIDAALGHGTTEMSGDWNLRAGVAWTLAANR
ncbi:MAG: hypothetical protein F4143_01055 [Gemmatimonadales bacterium]|nr:hypothetical protein [Gemmatimonadales bacterium]